MKAAVCVLAAVFVAGSASPARAQLGGILKGANKAVDAKTKFDDLNITDAGRAPAG